MKKTYQRPTALVVRVVTGNLMNFSFNPDGQKGTHDINNGPGATNAALTKRMYEIEVE